MNAPIRFAEAKGAGKPVKILLKSDRPTLTAGPEDLAYVEAAVVDSDGVLVPDATNSIAFNISGAAGKPCSFICGMRPRTALSPHAMAPGTLHA